MLIDCLTNTLTRVLQRPDLRVVAGNLTPVPDRTLSSPFRLVLPLPGSPSMSPKLMLGRPCLEETVCTPTVLRHAIELIHLLQQNVEPVLASFAAARVAALFHALDTTCTAPLPDYLKPFATESCPGPDDLLLAWPSLAALLKDPHPFSGNEARALGIRLGCLWTLLAPAETLMSSGGDSRLAIDPATGLNRYACSHRPRPWAVTFGSSTASSLSERGFDGAEQARRIMISALLHDPEPAAAQKAVIHLARSRIGHYFGVDGNGVVLCASGTDCELATLAIVAGESGKPVSNIVIAPDETGSGVPLAASGRHFATDSACANIVGKGELIDGFHAETHLAGVSIRHPDGTARTTAEIDADCRKIALREAARGRHVLLHRLDQSKTGIAAPSMELVTELRTRLGSDISIVVDACQMRLSPARVKSWISDGIMVMITGSKFFTGPPFCGALLLPEERCRALTRYKLPVGLKHYSNRSEWPDSADMDALNTGHNVGLALRWHAALAEMKALFAFPDPVIRRRLDHFMAEAATMLDAAPFLTLLPVYTPADDGRWDAIPTIRSFLVSDPRHPDLPLTLEDARKLHRWLNADLSPWLKEKDAALMCVLGQPVPVSHHKLEGQAGALRLCAGARLVSGEPAHAGLDESSRLARECRDAKRVLGKIHLILRYWNILLDADPAPRYAPISGAMT